MLLRRQVLATAAVTLAGMPFGKPARAQSPAAKPTALSFGRATEQSSIDPHFSQTGPNNATRLRHFRAPRHLHCRQPGAAGTRGVMAPA